ncbi:exosortase H-associated membrane protein [Haliea sp. E1-2-M8]|uniref:exosortase H-associated membrane protein n=1 Tax=Haliea sp. E1-2-M8 TaxID=3064706 RepID=UPI00271B47F4|nr:exosortase H-associated membrane protein [Haliea sp. E1-2-M8]MDO8861851.1 exosortase H-associated membrane protein [Haliea sp. E1-2-M8]
MTLYRFIGLVVLLMIPCFALWYALGALPAAPAVWLAQFSMPWAMPEIFAKVTLDQNKLMVFSQFGERNGAIVPLAEAEYQLAFPQSIRLLSYSIPFYTALHFASSIEASVERYARSLLVLWVLMFVGIIAVALKDVMLGVGAPMHEASGLPLPPEAIGLLYQFSVLIVPTVAPILLWAWVVRDSPRWRALLLGRPEVDQPPPDHPA